MAFRMIGSEEATRDQPGVEGSRHGYCALTFVVDVGGDLDVALLCVDWDVVEVFVLLQGEL